ncbi:MAG: TrmH family RNA methyltransferase [Deinococcales bacterium]
MPLIPQGVPTYNETSASAEKWVELEVLENVEQMLQIAKVQKMQILAAHLSDKALDYQEVDYCLPTCIVMGNEKWGVAEATAELVDEHIIIPMMGMVQSLNVSVATAVLLFEVQRQRLAAGFYDSPRLNPEEFAKQSFKWLHPREAKRLDTLGLAYPPLNDEGNISSV